ncbi:hypothetical protein AZI87_02070 [Bdellovibrio bacteriovorus]|uniref:Uncharacterized protein n=1 Tax=Bdellovibrio bacteriovorus TaxID=959 RepID=A0A162GG98_BDEBC|nr:hypothetical protein [Bdellovibrio bacteriovorus]KYG68072.1 hypothetical protein AZI87_02070 [Bdellovibrio bacteriovorus]
MSKSPQHSQALQVRHALWDLQKEVLNSLKAEFDQENGYQAAPTEWFQVLMTAERYAWLRELTTLMADIDIMTELEFITEQHLGTARSEIERMLIDLSSDDAFNKQFRELLMSGTALLPLHSQLRASLQNLPKSELSKDQTLAERKNWHEEHRHQAKKRRN